MPALVQPHSQDGVAGLQERREDGDVGRRARVRLDVGVVRAEQLLGPVDGELLHDVHILAAAVVALAGVALGVLVGQHRPLRFEHGAGDDVLRRDQFQLVVLPAFLFLDGGIDLRVGLRQRRVPPDQVFVLLTHEVMFQKGQSVAPSKSFCAFALMIHHSGGKLQGKAAALLQTCCLTCLDAVPLGNSYQWCEQEYRRTLEWLTEMPPLSAHGIDNAVTHLSTSQAFVHYTLFVSMMALGAAFVFFLVSKEKILPEYRGTLTTSALICGVAAVAYYYLTTEYGPGKPFPTDVRYVDWTVTTPLLLLKYPEMLRLRGFAFAWKLVLADLFMIVTGFIGELYGSTVDGHWVPNAANSVEMHYLWGAISTVGYLVILYLLLTEGSRLAKTQPVPIQHGIKSMNMYIWSLWGVYPLVYILEGMSAGNPEHQHGLGQRRLGGGGRHQQGRLRPDGLLRRPRPVRRRPGGRPSACRKPPASGTPTWSSVRRGRDMAGNAGPYVILGAGCAGLSLCYDLLEAGVTEDIVLLDRRTAFPDDRTWCFWNVRPHPFLPLVTHCWHGWRVYGPDGEEVRHTGAAIGYARLRAADFYGAVLERIARAPNVSLRLGESVEGYTEDATAFASDGTRRDPGRAGLRRARRGAHGGRPAPALPGATIQTSAPAFDPSCPTLMDFRVAQDDGVRFLYVLPLSPTEALVEDTCLGGPSLSPEAHRAAIADYARRVYGIERLPGAAGGGRVHPHARRAAPPAPGPARLADRPGGRGEQAEQRLHLPADPGAVPAAGGGGPRRGRWSAAPRRFAPRRFAFYDAAFLEAFAKHPERFPAYFCRLFQRVGPDALARFLSETSTWPDEWQVAAALPPGPFLRAAWAAAPQWLPHLLP